MSDQTASTPMVCVDRHGQHGDVVYLIRQLDRMTSTDRGLFLEIADMLPALGQYVFASWLFRRVNGRETGEAARIIAEYEDAKTPN